jgi:hypothetical protein
MQNSHKPINRARMERALPTMTEYNQLLTAGMNEVQA